MENTTKNVVQYGTAFGPSGYGQKTWNFQTGPWSISCVLTLVWGFQHRTNLARKNYQLILLDKAWEKVKKDLLSHFLTAESVIWQLAEWQECDKSHIILIEKKSKFFFWPKKYKTHKKFWCQSVILHITCCTKYWSYEKLVSQIQNGI